MKFFLIAIAAILFPTLALGEEEGKPFLKITIDDSKDKWVITVENIGDAVFRYDQIDKVPRIIGIEYWREGIGRIIYIYDTADHLYRHPFAPDWQYIKPEESRDFIIDPRSMSAEDEKDLEPWKVQFEDPEPFYDCRIFFYEFASPRIRSWDRRR